MKVWIPIYFGAQETWRTQALSGDYHSNWVAAVFWKLTFWVGLGFKLGSRLYRKSVEKHAQFSRLKPHPSCEITFLTDQNDQKPCRHSNSKSTPRLFDMFAMSILNTFLPLSDFVFACFGFDHNSIGCEVWAWNCERAKQKWKAKCPTGMQTI